MSEKYIALIMSDSRVMFWELTSIKVLRKNNKNEDF